MSLRRMRLMAVVVLTWFASGCIAWLMLKPGTDLVGLRRSAPSVPPIGQFSPPDLSEARSVLDNAILWGVRHDGSPLAAPVSKEEAQKKVAWKLLASVLRPNERYIVIQVADAAPTPVKEGQDLPDGGRLLKITIKAITIRTPEGVKRTIPTYVE